MVRATGGRAEQLLVKLAAGAGRAAAAASRPTGAAVSESLRAAARERLRAALGRSPAAASVAGARLDAAAQVRSSGTGLTPDIGFLSNLQAL